MSSIKITFHLQFYLLFSFLKTVLSGSLGFSCSIVDGRTLLRVRHTVSCAGLYPHESGVLQYASNAKYGSSEFSSAFFKDKENFVIF